MRVLVISDTQAPFHHPDALPFLKKIYKKYKCNEVVHIGDEADFKFLKYGVIDDPETAKEQHERTKEFLKQLYRAFPKMKLCMSNHGKRLEKKASESGIPNFFLKGVHDYFEVPKTWQWAEMWEVDGVIYEHGDRFRGIHANKAAAAANMKSTVIGHHNIFSIHYISSQIGTIFGMSVGMLTDCGSYGQQYAKIYPCPPLLGCGVVIDGKYPILEPFH